MAAFFQRYKGIPQNVRRLITVNFFISLLNGAYFLVFNLYLRKLGYDDPTIGSYGAMLYLGILIVGLPCGLFLRGRRLKPVYLAGSILIPLTSMATLLAFEWGAPSWAHQLLLISWSGSLVLIDSFLLPFIVRHVPESSQSEAIALCYSMFAVGSAAAGILTFLVNAQEGIFIGSWYLKTDEFLVLMGISIINLPLVFLLWRLEENDPSDLEKVTLKRFVATAGQYDWPRIGEAVLPTSIIAVGAGLTIPFIGLFFEAVFGMPTDDWGLVGLFMAIVIFIASNFVPVLRRKFGYRYAITLSQSLAVLMLIGMSLTELFADFPGMVYIAIGFFVLRTPLMHMARPMTSELVMNYVGRGNQDLVSALMASIWSGSWFVSAKIFQWLRAIEVPYYQIFLVTAGSYVIGVALYYRLILRHERQL